MSSQALQTKLEAVLADAEELVKAHRRLRTGRAGRQYGLGALNRAVVVMCAAAWEAYVEDVAIEALDALRPGGPPLGTWPALRASVLSQIGRFHTPSSDNVRKLLAESFGLADVTAMWCWQGCTARTAVTTLDDFLKTRHETAHGSSPRPLVHNRYSTWLPGFVRRLAAKTDAALAAHLSAVLGTAAW